MTDTMRPEFDVVVIGGGAAGLSGALALACSRRSVLVVDAGQPCNVAATGVPNFLTSDGMNPSALTDAGRAEVIGYGGHVIPGRVDSAARGDDGFSIVEDELECLEINDDQLAGNVGDPKATVIEEAERAVAIRREMAQHP